MITGGLPRRALPFVACAVLLTLTAAVYFLRPRRDLSGVSFSSVPTDVLTVNWKDLRNRQFHVSDQDVRVPGFMVPLEDDAEDVSEFLLIPYTGSCIHTPTPPRDQIVYVRMTADVHVPAEIRQPVWVYGRLIAQSAQAAAFQMLSTKIIPLEGEPQ